MKAVCSLVLLLVSISGCLFAQPDSSINKGIHRKRLKISVIAGSATYTAALIGLNELWYDNTPRQAFTFFNDNSEWRQMDKLGHFYSSFYLSYGASGGLGWCGLPVKRSHIAGALIGFGVMAPIELFDGFSEAYGASAGDLVANAAGSVFFAGQQLHWHEIRIYPKFSYHPTRYASIRPAVLGDNPISEGLKDYNGQTYWLSFDMDKFFRFPAWLNVAIGYGSEDLVYAREAQNSEAGYNAYRQYYLSPEIDLRAIKTRSKVIKALLFTVSLIKLPSPGIELSKHGARFHMICF